MKTILFFQAGTVPTEDEATTLAALLAQTEQVSVKVRSAAQAFNYGPRIEECDFVAGDAVPDEYSEVPVWSPSSELPENESIVSDGGTVAVHNSAGADSHNATAAVADNVLSAVKLAATVAMVDNSDSVVVHNSAGAAVAGTHAAAVAAGALTAVTLAATVAPVTNGTHAVLDAAGKTAAGTLVVAAGALSTITLAATAAILLNGATYETVDGGTLTVAVAAGVPTFTYTAGA